MINKIFITDYLFLKGNKMLKVKENKIILLVIIIVTCLMYNNFLTGYWSMDTDKIIKLGYVGYAINYSFYDGRILMGIICVMANIIHMDLKIFYIILLSISILISSITVLKLYNIINKYKNAKIKQKVILIVLVFCYIFNFMTINNMEYIECAVMAISIFLYTLAAENIAIKKEPKKVFLYIFLAGICYQGTINMLFLTTILFMLLEYKKEEKTFNKKNLYCIMWAIFAIIGNVILKLLIDSIIRNSIQAERLSINILENITIMFQKIGYLLVKSLDLFPKYIYLIFNIGSLIIIYIYCVKNKKIFVWYNVFFLFLMSIVSSMVLLIIYNGIEITNGRIFESIGASFSVMWIYAYVKTDIFNSKGLIKFMSVTIILVFLLINCYTIIKTTMMFKEVNEKDEELSKKIEQKIIVYEEQTGEEIKYVKIKYGMILSNDIESKLCLRSMILSARFNENTIKLYTNIDLEREDFSETDMEKVKDEPIICSENTVYVLIE